MIVGSAYVEVRAVTDKVRKEIKDGFQKGMSGVGADAGKEFDKEVTPEVEKTSDKLARTIRDKVGQAGDDSGRSFLDRLGAKLQAGGAGIGNRIRGVFNSAGDKSGNDFGNRFWSSLQKKFSSFPAAKVLLGSMASFIGPLVGLIGNLTGGVFALGSAISQAAGAVPVLYSSMVPLVSVMGGFKLAMSGVQKALHDALSGNTKLLAKDMQQLGPAAQGFVKQVAALNPEIKALKQTAAANLFPGLTVGIKNLMPLFGPFRAMIGQIDQALGTTAASVGYLLGGPLRNTMSQIFSRNATAVRALLSAIEPLIESFIHIYHAMQPVQLEWAHMIKRGAEWLRTVTGINDASGRMTAFFQRSFDRARELGRILVNVAGIVLNVAHAASGAGGTMLSSIEQVTKRWKTFTGSVGAQNSMKAWFDATVPVMHEIIGIIGDVIKMFGRLGGSKDLMPLLQQVRDQLLPAISNLLAATTGPVAASMIQLLTDLVNIFAKISGSGSTGFLNSFAQSMDLIARAINAVLSIPGVAQMAGLLGGIAGSVAAFGFVAGKLKIFSLAKNLLGFGDAAKQAAKGVGALELAKKTEAEKLALNDGLAAKNAGSYGKMSGAIDILKGKLGGLKGLLGKGVLGKIGGVGEKAGGGLGGLLGKAGIGAAAAGEAGAAEGAATGLAGSLAGIGAVAAPILAVVAAVAALAFGIYELVKHWDAVKHFFTDTLPHAITSAFDWVKDHWKGIAQIIISIFLPGGVIIAAIWKWHDQILGFFKDLPSKLLTLMRLAGQALLQGIEWALAALLALFVLLPIKIGVELVHLATEIPGLISAAGQALWHGAGVAVDATVSFFAALPGRVAHALASFGSHIASAVSGAFHWLWSHAESAASDTVHWFATLPGRIVSAVASLPGRMFSFGGSVVRSVASGLASAAKDVFTWFKNLPGNIIHAIGDVSKLLYGLGKKLIQGLIDGITGMAKDVYKKAKDLINHIPGVHFSPSLEESTPHLLKPIGRNIMKGLGDGIGEQTPAVMRSLHRAVAQMGGVNTPTLNAHFVAQVSGASGGAAASGFNPQLLGPLIAIEHFHVRDDSDIAKLERMLYKAQENVGRANGRRDVVAAP